MRDIWGTVCQDGMGTVDAQVACRQLGFSATGNIILQKRSFNLAVCMSARHNREIVDEDLFYPFFLEEKKQ